MEQASRLASLHQFRTEPTLKYLVATDVAARGLDIPSVQCVLMHSAPASYEQYVHRVGRTARASASGLAVSITGESDRKLVKQVMAHSTLPTQQRSIAPETADHYRTRIASFASSIEAVLAEEQQSRELAQAERLLQRAEDRLIEKNHEGEKRVWIGGMAPAKTPRPKESLPQSRSGQSEKKRKLQPEDTPQHPPLKAKRAAHRNSRRNDLDD